jgi:ATP-dependent DNA helicase RecG
LNDPLMTYEVLGESLGVSSATVKRRIQELKKGGQLRRVGSKKTGEWEVVAGAAG